MKIIYNDRVIVPCTISINCRQCVFNDDDLCKVGTFWKMRDLRTQCFCGTKCLGFKYENSI